jgi:uncharacterized membrane protein
MFRNAFLWIHVVCGAVWVVISLCFALAASATAESERASFALRVGRVFNRLNLAVLVILPLTGIANLSFVEREHHFNLPAAFVEVLIAKIALLCGMAAALSFAWSATAKLDPARDRSPAASGSKATSGGVAKLLWLYIAMAAMGAAALMLGVWLAGSA